MDVTACALYAVSSSANQLLLHAATRFAAHALLEQWITPASTIHLLRATDCITCPPVHSARKVDAMRLVACGTSGLVIYFMIVTIDTAQSEGFN